MIQQQQQQTNQWVLTSVQFNLVLVFSCSSSYDLKKSYEMKDYNKPSWVPWRLCTASLTIFYYLRIMKGKFHFWILFGKNYNKALKSKNHLKLFDQDHYHCVQDTQGDQTLTIQDTQGDQTLTIQDTQGDQTLTIQDTQED